MQGYRPALDECAFCGSPCDSPAAFDIEAGGVLCDGCAPGGTDPAAAQVVSWLRALIYSRLDELVEIEGAPVNMLLDIAAAWLAEHLSLNLRSLSFLRTLSLI